MTTDFERIVGPCREEAEDFLKRKDQPGIHALRDRIQKSPRGSRLLTRWSKIAAYLVSSEVPLARRAMYLAAILYIILPDPFPGPIDDMILGAILLPRLDKELERFDAGHYDQLKDLTRERSGNWFDVTDEEMSTPIGPANPFHVPEDD